MTSDDTFLDTHTFLGDGQPDTLDQRLAREIPDDGNGEVPFERQPDAVGELVAEPHHGEDDIPEEQVVLAQQARQAMEGDPAEQTAMHVVDIDDLVEEDYSAFVSDAGEEEDDEAEPENEEDAGEIHRDDTADEFVFDPEYDDDVIPSDEA